MRDTCHGETMNVGIEQLCLSPRRANRLVPRVPVELTRQVKKFGQIEPVVTRKLSDGLFEILANAEMWLAIQRAGLHTVGIIVLTGLSDDEAKAIVDNQQKLDPVTEAEWFQSQLSVGQGERFESVAAFARSIGVSRAYVSHSLRLLTLNPDIKNALRIGALKAGHGKVLLTLSDDNLRTRLASATIRQRWSVRKLEKETKLKLVGTSHSVKPVSKSPDVLSLEKRISGIVGSAIQIDEVAGLLTIDYRNNLDVLEGILARLSHQP